MDKPKRAPDFQFVASMSIDECCEWFLTQRYRGANAHLITTVEEIDDFKVHFYYECRAAKTSTSVSGYLKYIDENSTEIIGYRDSMLLRSLMQALVFVILFMGLIYWNAGEIFLGVTVFLLVTFGVSLVVGITWLHGKYYQRGIVRHIIEELAQEKAKNVII